VQQHSIIVSPEKAQDLEATYRVVRRSIDARQRELKVNLTMLTDDQGAYVPCKSAWKGIDHQVIQPKHLTSQSPIVEIVGLGPAGLFAALTLLEHGIRPVIYERGKEVSERKKDIALLNRNEGLNPESNYCFGEGGAGTFSDGKLFSRSKKRGNMQRVMEIFHQFGATDKVLYEAHAHIGSDRLPAIIRSMREYIIAHGGEIHFNTRWSLPTTGLRSHYPTTPLHHYTILAIGHSAHDTYRELAAAGVAMEAKGCAMGVRLEHPQVLINDIFYHHPSYRTIELVGNASYAVISQVNGRGVYSFCMCPGGHMVPAGSQTQSGVVNGMSASHRNSVYANSGMVVELHPQGSALDILNWQEQLEHIAWEQGGNTTHDTTTHVVAPAQRMKDFVEGIHSSSLPACSYLPGIFSSRLDQWLPEPISSGLRQGFRDFGRKYPGFLTNDAVLLGVESRSSSPIRIVRDPITMQSLSHPWLYPCGEGAGYAGGITSSALDGINAALAIAQQIHR